MKQIRTQFDSDGLKLSGILHLPDIPAPPLVVGSHGLEGTMASAKQEVLARLLPENQIAFFRFDHRGCGSSDGEFIRETSLEKRSRDLVAAVCHVMAMNETDKTLGLFGSSMGGATCIHAWQALAAKGFPPAGGVLCAAPLRSITIDNIPTEANGSRPALPLSFFAENLLFDLGKEATRLHHVLVFHGDKDEVVPVSNAEELYQLMQAPKELVIHGGGAHQMSDPAHQQDFEIQAAQWYRSILNQG